MGKSALEQQSNNPYVLLDNQVYNLPGNGSKQPAGIIAGNFSGAALSNGNIWYRSLVESIQTPLYATDVEGRIMVYNKAAADLWGREPVISEDLWCGAYRLLNKDGSILASGECPMAILLKEGRLVFGHELIIVRPDGALRHVIPHPQLIFDESNKLVGAVNMLIEIPKIDLAQPAHEEREKYLRQLASSLENMVKNRTRDLEIRNEELKKSEEKYHKMIEEVEDYAIVLLDKNGIIQNWNKGAENIKGYKEEEIVGKSFETFYFDEDRKSGFPKLLLELAKEKGKAIHEGWRRRKDGTGFWGSIVITALHDADNNIVGFSKVTRDLTERKSAEDKLVEYSRQLEFQNRELEQFAYASSHDMKEPLRKISFYNNFIAENPNIQLDAKSREYLHRSMSAVNRMLHLIEALIAYSKSSSAIENFETVNLAELLEEVILLHKDVIENEGIEIKMTHLPIIQGIPFQLRQLIDNLFTNALKYKHPSKPLLITIGSELLNGHDIKNEEAHSGTAYYKISIVDNGIGFNEKYANKIFEIFQRLNNRSLYEGSGVGLAICKKIVQNHKGLITASGKENEGASFDVYLPAEDF